MRSNKIKAAAAQGFFGHVVICFFVNITLTTKLKQLYDTCLYVDRICRLPFIQPVISFPKEYIDMLKGTSISLPSLVLVSFWISMNPIL